MTEMLDGELPEWVLAAGDLSSMLKPETRRELREYVRIEFGVLMEDRSLEGEGRENHRPLLDFVWDAFSQSEPRMIVWGPRKSGKTYMSAVLHCLNSKFYPGCWSTNVGAIEAQSLRGYDYITDMVKLPLLRNDLDGAPKMRKTSFKNGSIVEVLTGGSKRSVSGPSPNKFLADEFDHWEADVFDTAMQGTISDQKKGIMAQTMLVSSMYHEEGILRGLLGEAYKAGDWSVYKFDVWDVMQRCDPQPGECASCPLLSWVNPFTGLEETLCGGEIGPRCFGHVPVSDVKDKYIKAVNKRTFAMQQLLLGGQAHGLVYDVFSDDNVKSFEDEPVRDWGVAMGVDWGWSEEHQAGLLVGAQASDETVIILEEWKQPFALPSEHRRQAREMMERWGVQVMWADPRRPGNIAEWQQAGLPVMAAPVKPILDGVDAVRDKMKLAGRDPLLYVSPDCPKLIAEIRKTYVRKKRRDGSFANAPDENRGGNDLCACLRYMMLGGFEGGWFRTY